MFSANKEIYCYLGVSYVPKATGTYDVSKMYQNLGLSYHMYVPDIQKYHPRYPLVVTMRGLWSKTLPPLCRFSEPTCYQRIHTVSLEIQIYTQSPMCNVSSYMVCEAIG